MALSYQKNAVLTLLLLALVACGKQGNEEEVSVAPVPAENTDVAKVKVSPANSSDKKELMIPEVNADSLKTAISSAETALAANNLEGLDTQTTAALEWYLGILAFKPDQPEALEGLQKALQSLLDAGLAAQYEGNIGQAQHIAEVFKASRVSFPAAKKFLKQMPDMLAAEAMMQQGMAFEAKQQVFFDSQQEKSNTALAAYLKALTKFPNYQPAQNALSRLRIQQQETAKKYADSKNFDAALLALEKATPIDPKNPEFLMVVLHVRGQLNLALSHQVNLAHLALDGLRVQTAEQYYQKARALSASDVSVRELATRIDDVKHYGRFKAGQYFVDPWVMSNPAPEMVVIPYGSFRMGSDEGQVAANKSEMPAHDVRFTRGFAIARNEITVAQFKEFVENTAYQTRADKRGYSIVFDEKGGSLMQKDKINWRHDHLGRIADAALPVVHVSLHDAQAYANWLSSKTNQAYRLPSEAEFEYVQAAGSMGQYAWGDKKPKKSTVNLAGAGDKSTQSRSFGNAIAGYRDFYWGAAPVRSFPQEHWGSFDMTGNVAEWVEDCWHESYLRAPADGTAWVNPGCTEGVIRGGSWGSSLEQARIRFRMTASRKDHTAQIGFRVVREL